MDQIGLKIDGVNKCFFGPKIPVFLANIFQVDLRGIPLPPFADNVFDEQLLVALGGTPPPLIYKIRQTVFDRSNRPIK